VVLLDLRTSEYHSFNEVSSTLWERMAAGATIAELTAAVIEQFDASAGTVHRDVLAFLSRCDGNGWIER
jgi:hypothetical protein